MVFARGEKSEDMRRRLVAGNGLYPPVFETGFVHSNNEWAKEVR